MPPELPVAARFEDYYQDVPEYMTQVYDWAYVDPNWVKWLDHNIVVKILLFANDQRLMRAYLREIEPGSKVWQVAHVYGALVQRVADRVGPNGVFHLTDVTPIQIEHGQAKLRDKSWSKVFWHDAGTFQSEHSYDLICSFFLLHEVPEDKKRQIVNNMLGQLRPGSKAVFVDYHKPAWWQPIRYILKIVNWWLEPFAEAVWHHEISEYASHPENYVWTKRTLFGGVYQVLTVTQRDMATAAATA